MEQTSAKTGKPRKAEMLTGKLGDVQYAGEKRVRALNQIPPGTQINWNGKDWTVDEYEISDADRRVPGKMSIRLISRDTGEGLYTTLGSLTSENTSGTINNKPLAKTPATLGWPGSDKKQTTKKVKPTFEGKEIPQSLIDAFIKMEMSQRKGMNADTRQARSAATRSYGAFLDKADVFLDIDNYPGIEESNKRRRNFQADLTAILMGAPTGVNFAEASRQRNTVEYNINRKVVDKIQKDAEGLDNFLPIDFLGTKDVKTTQEVAAPTQETPTTPRPKSPDTDKDTIDEVEDNANIEQVIVTPETKSSRESALVEVAETPKGFVNRTEFQTKSGGFGGAAMYYSLQNGPYFDTKQEAINNGLAELRDAVKNYEGENERILKNLDKLQPTQKAAAPTQQTTSEVYDEIGRAHV